MELIKDGKEGLREELHRDESGGAQRLQRWPAASATELTEATMLLGTIASLLRCTFGGSNRRITYNNNCTMAGLIILINRALAITDIGTELVRTC
jgi:hypothetical protein